MWGAIIGDIVGSRFEFNRYNHKSEDFEFFTKACHITDDSVLTCATASVLLNNKFLTPLDYALAYKQFGEKYPGYGYGSGFQKWLYASEMVVSESYGNGSAMRVSPIGVWFTSLDEVLEQAKRSCLYTHAHPEGIKGAQAVAAAIFMSHHGDGNNKQEIKQYISDTFGYDLDRTLDEIRPTYKMDATCQGSVPQAIIAFLESDDFESAIRKAISIGGDSDTIAAIAGSIAERYYNVPCWMINKAKEYLDENLLSIIDAFDTVVDNK